MLPIMWCLVCICSNVLWKERWHKWLHCVAGDLFCTESSASVYCALVRIARVTAVGNSSILVMRQWGGKYLRVASFGQQGTFCFHELIGCEKTWIRVRSFTSAGEKRGAGRYDNKRNLNCDRWDYQASVWYNTAPHHVAKSYLDLHCYIVPA